MVVGMASRWWYWERNGLASALVDLVDKRAMIVVPDTQN